MIVILVVAVIVLVGSIIAVIVIYRQDRKEREEEENGEYNVFEEKEGYSGKIEIQAYDKSSKEKRKGKHF